MPNIPSGYPKTKENTLHQPIVCMFLTHKRIVAKRTKGILFMGCPLFLKDRSKMDYLVEADFYLYFFDID